MTSFDLKVVKSLKTIDPKEWDDLVGLGNPFSLYSFLYALETSASVGTRTGWFPRFYCAFENAKLVGAIIAYEKLNSYGEYVFDHGFADAYQRHGLRYYPKLQIAIPFTPASAPKIFGVVEIQDRLIYFLKADVKEQGYSSVHATFLSKEIQSKLTKEHGFFERSACQYYYYRDENVKTFDDYLAGLKRSQRKTIKKERQSIMDNKDIVIRAFSGDDLTQDHMRVFYQFYLQTLDKKWGVQYLTPDFFIHLQKSMASHILLYLAFEIMPDGKEVCIAGAINFIGQDALYGRYWGATKQVDFLHFELCYYRAIEYAIENGLARVEAGAQGEHKLKRGYAATEIKNAVYIEGDIFKEPIERFLRAEKQDYLDRIDYLNEKYFKGS